MKKVVSILLGMAMVASLSVPALAATSDTLNKRDLRVGYGVWPEEVQASGDTAVPLSETLNDSDLRVGTGAWSESGEKSQLVLPNTEPRYEDSLVTSKALTINVDINSPLESDWRNTYSNYYYEANRIVEKVDDYLSDEFGIDFYTKSQPHWSFSTSATGINAVQAALDDAIDSYGTGSADLMIAFAGPIGDVGSSAIFGATYKGNPYCILLDHDYYQNCKSTQHEVGHAYGLDECQSSSACVMRQGADTSWKWFNHLCSTDHAFWDSKKDSYGG